MHMVSVAITLEQLITAVKTLAPEERAKVANVLIQTELQSDLTNMLADLYEHPAADDITDDEIMAEIKAVRLQAPSV